MDKLDIKITDVSFHRNGIGGEGFYAVLFDYNQDGTLRHMVASLFDGDGRCAVYDVDQLKSGNIAFANGNSWRGDKFENQLRDAIKKAPTNRMGPFAIPQAAKTSE